MFYCLPNTFHYYNIWPEFKEIFYSVCFIFVQYVHYLRRRAKIFAFLSHFVPKRVLNHHVGGAIITSTTLIYLVGADPKPASLFARAENGTKQYLWYLKSCRIVKDHLLTEACTINMYYNHRLNPKFGVQCLTNFIL